MPKKKIYSDQLHVLLPAKLAKALTAAADHYHVTESEITRQALKDFLAFRVEQMLGDNIGQ